MIKVPIERRQFLKTSGLLVGATGSALSAHSHDEGLGGVLLYSGWATKNIGDIGHTPGTLRYLEEYCPEVPVTLWLRQTNRAVTAMLRRRFPKLQIVQGRLDGTGKADTSELQAAFDACRFFLHNSGMHYNRFWPPPKHLLTSCIKHGKPFGLFGQSFDGFWPKDEKEMVDLLSHAAFIFTRDAESLFYLRNIGVRADVLEFGPDGCFGIDVRDDEKAERYMQKYGLLAKEFLTVTIRTHTRGDLIESEDPEGDAERAARLRSVITDWIQTTGKKVLLAPEVEKEILAAERFLYSPLPAEIKKQVVWRDTFWNADEAVSIYANARAMVAMEPHSLIMGLAMGTPIVHYFLPQHGVKGFMFRDIGLPEWLMKIMEEPPEHVSATLRQIDQDYERAQMKVRRAMQYVHQRSAEMMAVLRRSL